MLNQIIPGTLGNKADDSVTDYSIRSKTECHHISFKWEVTSSNTLTGAGPKPNTVRDPAAIWVLPASSTKYTGIPLLAAFSNISSISSSVGHLTAIFAQPVFSQAESALGHCLWARL